MLAIKDMEEMPNCCIWDCPLAREDGGACQLADVRTSDKERPKDCPLTEIVTCKNCKHWKDSDGVYRRGIGAESKCPINIKEVFEGKFYCGKGERRE